MAMFDSHYLSEKGVKTSVEIRARYRMMLTTLENLCTREDFKGNAREFALAKTHLETSCFYAIRAMSMDPENQERDSLDPPAARNVE